MFSRPERVGLAGRLSPDMARNTCRRVSAGKFPFTFSLTIFSDPMIARSSMQSRRILSTNTLVVLIIIKGNCKTGPDVLLFTMYASNFTQFYSTKSERERNLQREYDAQMEYRKHLQAFIDRWRYNANRAAQAQSKIKILEKVKATFLCCTTFIIQPRSFQSLLHRWQRKQRYLGVFS